MRLVYVNADPGIPLLGSKGASIHVRASLRAFASCVEALSVISARIEPKSGPTADSARLPARIVGPVSRDPGVAGALRANDEVASLLDELHGLGELDVIYERMSLWSVAGAEAARRLGVPWFLEVNAPLAEEASTYRDLEGRQLAFHLQRSRLVAATGVVVVSDELRRWAVDAGADPDRVLVAPNGCDPQRLRPAANGRGGNPFTVVFVGSLKPWHGLDTLADAFVHFHSTDPESRLVVVGDGPAGDSIRARLSDALPPSAFHLTGAVSHREVARHLQRADVAVAPYPPLPDFYFSPLKILEYCAAGLPVVASRIGQIEATLTDGQNALLVEPGSATALADALRRVRSETSLRDRLRRGARELAEQRSWGTVTGNIVDWMTSRVATAGEAALSGATR